MQFVRYKSLLKVIRDRGEIITTRVYSIKVDQIMKSNFIKKTVWV